ncbi:retrotransposon-like family member retr-1 [Paramuricea clavata]|uniref:Retrotransposon-like family member retr-1 n=1 Tax=Paramuricea clavata TaxID=317549 RepID=A0A6S7KZD1_PARCT|nr:retrotransposon-like family member retr-1 [Paramuricea clavata]
MIICGISDNALRERMLREPNINLQKAVELGQASEQTKLHAQQLTEDMEKKIHKVHRQKREKERRDKNRDRFKSHSPERDNLIKNCKFCAGRHQRGKCPAYGQKCNKCQRRNHFARCCKQTVHQVDDSQDRASFESSSESDFVIESLVATESEAASEVQQALKIDPLNSDTSAGHWSVTLNAGSQDIPFKIDTGAQVNVLPKKLYNKLNQLAHESNKHQPSCPPTMASQTTPILGLATSERLNLIKRVYKITDTNIEEAYSSNISEEYADCFGEIGTLKSTYHMTLKDDVRPVVVPPRKVPFALKDRLKKELDRMESMEEIISQMSGARFFSKLDASNGYWQIAVDDFTSDLLTFGTAFGRYKFKRMPYGIHSASEIFQLEISKIIAGCDGAANSQDDIIVWGETKEIHDQRLKKVLDKIRDSGLKLNHAKCIFGATELTFLGHIMSADGVKPDPRKIEAITKMPVPTSPAELQRFLGMVNYLGKFIPNLSDETAPLRALLKKGTEFLMQKPQIDAFEKLKRRISSVPVLQFYDPNLPTRIRTDSSSIGLGAMLEQRIDDSWHPIAFASRTLEKSEQNYAQIERQQIIVPKSMRPEIRTLLHQGHQGIEKCKSRARQAVYWPGINHELTVLVSQCATCTNHRNRQQKETLIPHDVPDQPWVKVGTDLFSLHGRDYLIVVDYHSKFFEVAHIAKPVEAPAVVREMKKIFSRHGIPQTVFSDNGPQYTAASFKLFSREWDFQHDTSSPHFP